VTAIHAITEERHTHSRRENIYIYNIERDALCGLKVYVLCVREEARFRGAEKKG
jgi:hypothetical protein